MVLATVFSELLWVNASVVRALCSFLHMGELKTPVVSQIRASGSGSEKTKQSKRSTFQSKISR